jgi:hypothetical protein
MPCLQVDFVGKALEEMLESVLDAVLDGMLDREAPSLRLWDSLVTAVHSATALLLLWAGQSLGRACSSDGSQQQQQQQQHFTVAAILAGPGASEKRPSDDLSMCITMVMYSTTAVADHMAAAGDEQWRSHWLQHLLPPLLAAASKAMATGNIGQLCVLTSRTYFSGLFQRDAVWQPSTSAVLRALLPALCSSIVSQSSENWRTSDPSHTCQLLQLAALADLQATQKELRRQGVAAALLARLQQVAAPLPMEADAWDADIAKLLTANVLLITALCSGLMCSELQQAGAMALMEQLMDSQVGGWRGVSLAAAGPL